jgi:dTDP-4-amino-4,6-dideoxygalactose transaminase
MGAVMYTIPFMRPNLVKKEKYLHYLDQIDDNRLYTNFGPLNSLFEQRVLQEYFQGEGAVITVNNATTGLMLAIQCAKRKTGKYAIMPSFTFPATALAAQWCGLTPFFVDIDSTNWALDIDKVKEAVLNLGEELAVVIPYPTFGNNIDLTYYQQLEDSGVPVVIDAAASFGAKDDLGQFGMGFSGYVVYSFHATKGFGIGEGGLVYSKDSFKIGELKKSSNFGFFGARETQTLSLNGKIPEVSAAIALATLDCFDEKIKVRNTINEWYDHYISQYGLLELGWECQEIKGKVIPLFRSILSPNGNDSSNLTAELAAQGIQVAHYFSPPCHKQVFFMDCPKSDLDVTENVSERIFSLPLWEEMEEQHVNEVVKSIASNLS